MLTTRRQALKTLTAAAIGSTALGKLPTYAQTPAPAPAPAAPTGPYTLPALPYAYEALEPYIDAETMHLHHDKHHKSYVTKLNEALAKEPSFKPPADVNDLIKNLEAVPESIRTAVRNQGGGHANHSLFWRTLQPTTTYRAGAVTPSSDLTQAIANDQGSLDKLKAQMNEQGGKLFGSGWVWLVVDKQKKLRVFTSPNQDSPFMNMAGSIDVLDSGMPGAKLTLPWQDFTPLFGIDVWEHAYYLKYKNVRADYLTAIWNVVNWDFISARYATAMKA